MHVSIRPFGNSRGIVIPKPLLTQLGLVDQADLTVEDGALVIRKPASPARAGWADAAKALASQQDVALLLGDFGNEGDEDLQW
jgi:antitoxin MazE